MNNLKSLLFLLLILVTIISCKLDSDNYQSFTGYASVDESRIPDTAFTGQTVPVFAHAWAPNGCWSDLVIHLQKSSTVDTLYGISATGFYESYNGICTEIAVTTDTIFNFIPDSSGSYIFVTYTSDLVPSFDTLMVLDPLPDKK